MNALMGNIQQYLQEILGISIMPTAWDDSKRLPFYLRSQYTYFGIKFLNQCCLLVHDNHAQEQSSSITKKHLEKIRNNWKGEVVYVRERLSSYNRKRLIELKISFLIPGKQMYLPTFGVHLREHFTRQRSQPDKFSPSAQALIIHILHHEFLDQNFTPTKMAHELGYSSMTMTRAFDEFELACLGEISLEGRERIIRFSGSKKDNWEIAKRFLGSPVKKRLYIEQPIKIPQGVRASLTALADLTMLEEPIGTVIAITSENWKVTQQNQRINILPIPEPGAVEIEVWSYDPIQFATEGVVDRLSLFLSLQDNKDERVGSALENMMAGFNW